MDTTLNNAYVKCDLFSDISVRLVTPVAEPWSGSDNQFTFIKPGKNVVAYNDDIACNIMNEHKATITFFQQKIS